MSTFCLPAVALLLMLATPVAGQAQPSIEPPASEFPRSTDIPEAAAVAPDSPQAAVRAYLDAANAGRWDEAARYLSLTGERATRGAELARKLKGVIDSRQLIDLEAVPNTAEGRLDDGLPADREDVAVVPIDGAGEPMRVMRTPDGSTPSWVFSIATVERIDAWYADLPDRWLRDLVADARLEFLLRAGPFDVLWWQWIGLPFAALLSWGLGRALRSLASPLIGRVTARTENHWDDRIVDSIGPPLTLALGLMLFAGLSAWMQLPAPATRLSATVVRAGLVFAFFWGSWRSIGVVMGWLIHRPWAASDPSARNLLTIGSNVLRGVLVGIGILAILASVGYPVGTVVAGLGIGGLALAFGAQKTVENAFGSISLAIDQPFRVGDFVRVDDFVGTVEDIGLRSTRFRTLDRTVVSIPNGQLADQRLESFEVRDRMRLATTIGVTYSTTRRQMQTVLAGLEAALRAHPKIWPDAVVVKFKEFGASSLDIEIMAWFQVPTWGDFQQCREEVLLDFMRVVEEAGTQFAFPTRTVHLIHERAGQTPDGRV